MSRVEGLFVILGRRERDIICGGVGLWVLGSGILCLALALHVRGSLVSWVLSL